MTTYQYAIVNSVVSILNSHCYDPLPATERSGDMWFAPEQKLVFNRQMPKGKVYATTTEREDRSFGNEFQEVKTYFIDCIVFTKKGDTDPTLNIKDRELCEYILGSVESTLKTYPTGVAIVAGFGETGAVTFDEENGIFIGRLPVIFKVRE